MRVANSGRGAYPGVTEDTLALFGLDAVDRPDLIGGRTPGDGGLGGVTAPTVGTASPALASLVFSGATNYRQAAAVSGDDTALLGTFTVTTIFRLRTAPTGTDTVWAFAGPDADGDVNDNVLFALRIDETGTPARPRLRTLWEDSGEVDVETSMTSHRLYLDRWYVVTHVVRGPTASETGPRVLDVYVNGVLVEKFESLAANSDGANAVWSFGARLDAAGTGITEASDVEIACVHVEAAQTDVDDIREDMRRLLLWSFPTNVHTRVQMEDQASTLQDMSDYLGVDWVRAVNVDDDNEQPMRMATIELLREYRGLSLALLRTDSKTNLSNVFDPTSFDPFVEFGRTIVLGWARLPKMLAPLTADWQEWVRGTLDEPDWGGSNSTIKLRVRDQGGVLQDKYVRVIRDYPQTFGGGGCPSDAAPFEDMLQEYIDDNFAGPPSLFVRDDPDVCARILEPKLARNHVLPNLRMLSAQVGGFDCRYIWDPGTDAFRLTLFEPGRDRVDVDAPIDIGDLRSAYRRAAIDRINVRNLWELTYPDSSKLDSNDNRLPSTVTATDPPSVSRFNEMAAFLREEQTSVIDSAPEAQAMVDAALADTKDPAAMVDGELALMPELEPHDRLSLEGDRLYWTIAQSLGVRRVSHRAGADDDGSSSLSFRGQPALGPKRWIEMESRPGLGKPPIADAGEATFERGIGSLVPVVAGMLERTDYFAGGRMLEVKNHDFSRYRRDIAAYPPDSWEVVSGAGTWGTEVLEETTVTLSGGLSIQWTEDGGGSPTEIRSDFIPIPGGDDRPLTIELVQARAVAVDNRLEARLDYYDGARAFLSAGPIVTPPVTAGVNTFQRTRSLAITPPAGARFCRLRIGPPSGGWISSPADHYLDAAAVYQLSHEVKAHLAGVQDNVAAVNPVVNNAWTQVNLDTETRDWGSVFDPTSPNFIFTAKEDGLYDIVGQVTHFMLDLVPLDATLGGGNVRLNINAGGRFIHGSGSTFIHSPVAANRYESPTQVAASVQLARGDTITLEGYILNAAPGAGGDTFGFLAGADNTFLTIKLRSAE